MDELSLTRELVYWALGLGGPLVLFIAFFWIFRRAFRADVTGRVESDAPGSREAKPAAEPEAKPAAEPEAKPAAEPEAKPAAAETAPAPAAGLTSVLANTKSSVFGRLKAVFSRANGLGEAEMEEIEEILYTSDLGPQTVQLLLGAVRGRRSGPGEAGEAGFAGVRSALRTEMLGIFARMEANKATQSAASVEMPPPAGADISEFRSGLESLNIWSAKPSVVMVVGVNGAGKTTTIGKLARRISFSGRRVLVAAGDTFRAAAGDQLKVWTERAQVEIFSPEGVTDPSAVAFDACKTAEAKGFDVVIVDTAGRLHTQKNLMEELKKMKRVVSKALPGGPHEVLLVLDANSGQNALQQAREFQQALDVSGVVLTKLDGTAKGGVAVGLACELGLPIKMIGVGEGVNDLRGFSAVEFVDSII